MSDQPVRNGILRALPKEDLAVLLPACTPGRLKPGVSIEPRMQTVETVYFPTSGVASVVAKASGGKELETGPVGWEGMTGLPVVYGVGSSPTETIVQIEGDAIVAPAEAVRDLAERSPAAKKVFDSYAYAFSL